MRFGILFCFGFALAGACAAQDSNFSTGPQYLMNYGSPQFLHCIATPSLSLSAPPPNVSAPATEPATASEPSTPSAATASSEAQRQPGLWSIYWGGPQASEKVETSSVIEISGAEAPSNLPASIVNVGVEVSTDAQSLRQQGYGVTVSEASSFWKTHKPHAPRVYTNRDIERLRSGA